jgi:NAD-dependent SIR2 family protein deacetylase
MVAATACLAGGVGAGLAAEAGLPDVCELRDGWDNFRVDLGQMDEK